MQIKHAFALPGIGSASGFGGKRGDKETFYSFSGYTTPSTIYRYDVALGNSSIVRQPKDCVLRGMGASHQRRSPASLAIVKSKKRGV